MTKMTESWWVKAGSGFQVGLTPEFKETQGGKSPRLMDFQMIKS